MRLRRPSDDEDARDGETRLALYFQSHLAVSMLIVVALLQIARVHLHDLTFQPSVVDSRFTAPEHVARSNVCQCGFDSQRTQCAAMPNDVPARLGAQQQNLHFRGLFGNGINQAL